MVEMPDGINKISSGLGEEGMDLIRDVCDVSYTRLPGSKNEARAQAFLEKRMRDLGADEVKQVHFKVHSRFFRWWPELSMIFFLSSLALYLVSPVLALVLSILTILNIILKMFSFDFLDVFFKNHPSSNVVGKLLPAGGAKPKRVLIIGGHTDSNYEYPIGSKYGTKMIKLLIPVFVFMILWVIAALIKTIAFVLDGKPFFTFSIEALSPFFAPRWYDILFYVIICSLPYVCYIGFNMVSSKPVPGANDNLSGIAVTMQLLKYYASNPGEKPSSLELWFVCFGSEEGGMKGSKKMAKDVKAALDEGSFPAPEAWVINYDSIGMAGPLHIATKEPMYRCTYLPSVYENLSRSAEKAGVEHHLKSLAAGTDSAPFGRLGIPATGILAFGDASSPANWHSLEDTPENVDVRGLVNCIKMTIQFIKDVDERLK
ncbi:MAG: M28 family metallopeptidase [Promethearchaeota archaeon]